MGLFTQFIPLFLCLVGAEALFCHLTHRKYYKLYDSLSNLALGSLLEVVNVLFKSVLLSGYLYFYNHFQITYFEYPIVRWTIAILGVDFCYYWFHRVSHRCRFFWAFHVVHHQSEEYNLSVALRQSDLGGAVSWIFYVPLALLGISPELFVTSYVINLLYQFWIHTRLIGRLGPLEMILNTPSHHRVHHGRNAKYLDKNYAGILILWDRLFGTFIEEKEEPTYGIVKPLNSFNPIWANLHVWVETWHRLKTTPGFPNKLALVFLGPER